MVEKNWLWVYRRPWPILRDQEAGYQLEHRVGLRKERNVSWKIPSINNLQTASKKQVNVEEQIIPGGVVGRQEEGAGTLMRNHSRP
jgi:hypothetical protein